MERYYNIAGIRYRISAPEKELSPEEGALAPFRTDDSRWDQWLRYTVTERLDDPEGELIYSDADRVIYVRDDAQIRYEGAGAGRLDKAYLRIFRRGNESHIQVRKRHLPVQITPKLIQNSMETEHQLAARKGILFHSAFIQLADWAILFTAPSGTGKSTQADLWCSLRGAQLVNGDRAAIVLKSTEAQACGIPFSGSSGVSENVRLPLAAIVYLSQAPENAIAPLRGSVAFRRIWEGCSVNLWNKQDVSDSFQTAVELAQSVPVYHLSCTPDERAVLILERELWNRGIL